MSNDSLNLELLFPDDDLDIIEQHGNNVHHQNKTIQDLIRNLEEKLVEIESLKNEISKYRLINSLIPEGKTSDQILKMFLNNKTLEIYFDRSIDQLILDIENQQYDQNNSSYIYIKNNIKIEPLKNQLNDKQLPTQSKVNGPPNLIVIKSQPFFVDLVKSLSSKLTIPNLEVKEKEINDLEKIQNNDIIFFASACTATIVNSERDNEKIKEIRSKIGYSIPILYCIFNMGKEAKPIINIKEAITSFSLTHSVSDIDRSRNNNDTLISIKNILSNLISEKK
ncbi:hypothetical protein RB653_009049 [Dictyostelium firmibasis]|uniref:Uncharacterized protein n=1 Tax=Dictyostelium firmibasis TaxID=79012 RepID=A0AAN7YX28_9MYCE